MSRGLVTRIQKLEARRRNEGEILLLWRSPGKDISPVASAAKGVGLFASGDRVMSLEWLGDDRMPKPRWVAADRGAQRQDSQNTHFADPPTSRHPSATSGRGQGRTRESRP